MAISISGTKKIPNTHTTASKFSFENLRASMSPSSNSMLVRPVAFVRANSKSFSDKSIPITFPACPTTWAAGSAEAPAPQQTSSTRDPTGNESNSIVRPPK
jgi:hypothetical protein